MAVFASNFNTFTGQASKGGSGSGCKCVAPPGWKVETDGCYLTTGSCGDKRECEVTSTWWESLFMGHRETKKIACTSSKLEKCTCPRYPGQEIIDPTCRDSSGQGYEKSHSCGQLTCKVETCDVTGCHIFNIECKVE